jgi:autotransporter-associated beta strand protein
MTKTKLTNSKSVRGISRKIQLAIGLLVTGMILLSSPTYLGAANIYSVSNASQLADAIRNAASGDIIRLNNDIVLDQELPPITTGVAVDGDGYALDGDESYRGLFIDAAGENVTVQELQFENCIAQGGDGGDGQGGGGGGAGLGGALFVRNGDVDLTDCLFENNSAVGGDGGEQTGTVHGASQDFNYNNTYGGGGGLGGDGGSNTENATEFGGAGGGGIGADASGGNVVGEGDDPSLINGGDGTYLDRNDMQGGQGYGADASVGDEGEFGGGGSGTYDDPNAIASGGGGGDGTGLVDPSIMDANRGQGGQGAWGGGGGGGTATGGDGGFGGGGGAAGEDGSQPESGFAGDGGFGGGGGGGQDLPLVGLGGFGAGDGGVDNPLVNTQPGETGGLEEVILGGTGGGGLGGGGALYVSEGSNLTLHYTDSALAQQTFLDNDALGGLSGGGTAGAGQGIGAAALLGGNITIDVAPGEEVVIDQDIAGAASDESFDPTADFQTTYAGAAGGITKSGDGSLILEGQNTTVGTTNVTGGELIARNGNALGDYSHLSLNGGDIVLEQDETIGYLSGTSGTVQLNGQTLELIGGQENDPNAAFGGTFSTESVTNPGVNLLASRIVKRGDGTFGISGDNSAQDFRFEIHEGTVALGHAGALGSSDPGSNDVKIYTSPYAGDASDTNTLEALNDMTGANAVGQSFFIEQDAELKVGGLNDIELAGRIRGDSVAVGMDDPNSRLILSNNNTDLAMRNQYTTTRILGGTLEVDSQAALGGSLIMLDGIGKFQSGAVNLVLSNNILLNSSNLLTIGGANNIELNGILGGTGGLIKTDAMTLKLSGVGNYLGQTQIEQGTLIVQGGQAILDQGVVMIDPAGVLQVDGSETVGAITGSGGIVLNGADLTLFGSGADPYTFGGLISGTGGLVKSGPNVQTLNGINSYTGGTSLLGGTLAIDQVGAIGSGALTMGNGAVLLLNQDAMTLGNAVTVNGSGLNGMIHYNETSGAIVGGRTFTLGGSLGGSGVLRVDLKGALGAESTFFVNQDNIAAGFGGFNAADYTTLAFNGTGAINVPWLVGTPRTDAMGADLQFASSNDVLFNGTILNGGAFNHTGAGTLTLANASVDASSSLINGGGTMAVTNGSFTSGTPMVIDNGSSLIVNNANGGVFASDIVIQNGLFSGEGSVDGHVTNRSGGTIHAGNSPGVRMINGDFTNEGGTIAVDIEGNESSLLQVSGTATIDGGTLAVTAAPDEDLYEGLTYVFLASGDLVVNNEIANTTFNNLQYKINTDYNEGYYIFTLESTDFLRGQGSFTSNQLAMGKYLAATFSDIGEVAPPPGAGSSDMENVLIVLKDMTTQTAAYDQMTGESFGSLSSATMQYTSFMNQVLGMNLRPSLLGARGAGRNAMYRGQGGAGSDLGLWGTVFGLGGSADGNNNAGGFNFGMGGTLLGFERTLIFDADVGVYYSYGMSGFDSRKLRDEFDVDNHHWGLYLNVDRPFGYFTLAGDLGYNQYEGTRVIDVDNGAGGFIPRTAESDHGGWQTGAYTELGTTFTSQGYSFQPYGALQYVYLEQDAFTETGAGALNLVVDSIDYDSCRSIVGARGGKAFGSLSLDVRAQWMHELLSDRAPIVSAQLLGGQAPGFTVAGADLGRDWVLVGSGFEWEASSRLRMYGGYDLQMNRYQSFHTGSGGVVLNW